MADSPDGAASPTARGGTIERLRPANIKLAIFDCDGVLIDSEPIASATLAEALTEFGVDITPTQAHATFTGFSDKETRAFCREQLGVEDLDGLFRVWSKQLYRGFESLTEMQGIAEVVSALDCPICVASNSSLYRLTRGLGRLDLWRIFGGHVFSADLVSNPKPAPDLPLLCARDFGVDPGQCIMIDDSPHGIESAVAAGILPIGFVDTKDPRPNRREVLFKHGAALVAEGSADLRQCIVEADRMLAGPRHGARQSAAVE